MALLHSTRLFITGSNLYSNDLNLFRIVWICFLILRILSNGSSFHSNTLNPFRVVWILIGLLHIPFKWLKFAFECFEALSNASKGIQTIWMPILTIWKVSEAFKPNLKWFECGFEAFESHCNASNLHSNGPKPVVRWLERVLPWRPAIFWAYFQTKQQLTVISAPPIPYCPTHQVINALSIKWQMPHPLSHKCPTH